MNQLSNNPAEDIEPISPFGQIDYGIDEVELGLLADSFADITQVTNRAEYDKAQAAVTALTRQRTKIETRRKGLKSASLEFGRSVDSTAKELVAIVEPQESRIKAMLDVVKAERAAKKEANEQAERDRVNGILEKIESILAIPTTLQHAPSIKVIAQQEIVDIWNPTEREYAEFRDRAIEVKTQVVAELEELYQGALHDERIAAKEQEEREAQDAANKVEAERLATERAEMDAAQAIIDAENKTKAENLAAQQAEIEAANQAKADELAAQQAEIQAGLDLIAKGKAEEQKRVDAEAAKKAKAAALKESKARAKRLQPDKQKIIEFADTIAAIEAVEVKTDEAKALVAGCMERLLTVSIELARDAGEL